MARDRIQLPSGSAGLTRYFDEYKSRITFKPGHIIILIIVVMIIVLLLHYYGSNLLGI